MERRKGGGVFWGTGFWGTGVEPGTQYTEKVICSAAMGDTIRDTQGGGVGGGAGGGGGGEGGGHVATPNDCEAPINC